MNKSITTGERCDCGHAPSDHSDFTTGYGKDASGKTFCYDCCHKQDLETLKTAQRFFAYYSGPKNPSGRWSDTFSGYGGTISNWPGNPLGRILWWQVCYSPVGGRQFRCRIQDAHGAQWYGVGAWDNGNYVRLRKLKTAI